MACLHLAWRAAVQSGWALSAVTVDHALREGAAAEAQSVAAFCEKLGIPHQVLRWEHGAIAGNLQDQARRARYGLIADWAATQEIGAVLLGHTADDNAETFMMGLARGAGLEGLTGMRLLWTQGRTRFIRPLLDTLRQDLRAYLTRHGIAWVDDPSNDNPRFARVKMRGTLKTLAPLGITAETLGTVITNLAYAQSAVRWSVKRLAETATSTTAGTVTIERWALDSVPDEIARRLLIAALQWVSGAEYAPRAEAIFRVFLAIRRGKDATLAGCRIRVQGDRVCVVREPRAVAGLVVPPGQLWDGRWQVDGPFTPDHELRALGVEGLRQCKAWRATGHSRDSLLVSPAVWYNALLIAAPIAGFDAEFSARIVAPFTDFILSH